jgi:predicted TIM-barrel fold metal-dependent hydrolase
MRIIDTHQHLWDLDLLEYPWLEDVPALKRSYRIEDYLKATEGLQIEKSVYVEADVAESLLLEETNYVLEIAEREANPLEGVVAGSRPESVEFADYIERIKNHRKLKGVRRVLHTQPDELGQQPEFIRNVAQLARHNLSFDICVLAHQLSIALNLAKQCPDVVFILDHCGVPDVKGQALDPWQDQVAEIAACTNVVCKISGLVAYADPASWRAEDLRPFVDHVIDTFGWDRVMFGSDWPVCTLTASYREWVEALQELVADAEVENQAKLFSENARRVYRL